MLEVARCVNLVLAGLLAGNELGTTVAIHPSLEWLGTRERIRAEQEVTRRYAAIMPFWMSSVIVSCLPVLALSRGDGLFCGDARLEPDRQHADQQPRARDVPRDGRGGVRGVAETLGQAPHASRRIERGRAGSSVRRGPVPGRQPPVRAARPDPIPAPRRSQEAGKNAMSCTGASPLAPFNTRKSVRPFWS